MWKQTAGQRCNYRDLFMAQSASCVKSSDFALMLFLVLTLHRKFERSANMQIVAPNVACQYQFQVSLSLLLLPKLPCIVIRSLVQRKKSLYGFKAEKIDHAVRFVASTSDGLFERERERMKCCRGISLCKVQQMHLIFKVKAFFLLGVSLPFPVDSVANCCRRGKG